MNEGAMVFRDGVLEGLGASTRTRLAYGLICVMRG